MEYQEMIESLAKKYSTTIQRMDIAIRAFAGSDDYECILLDVAMMRTYSNKMSKDQYLKLVSLIRVEDFEKIINGTHCLVQ